MLLHFNSHLRGKNGFQETPLQLMLFNSHLRGKNQHPDPTAVIIDIQFPLAWEKQQTENITDSEMIFNSHLRGKNMLKRIIKVHQAFNSHLRGKNRPKGPFFKY